MIQKKILVYWIPKRKNVGLTSEKSKIGERPFLPATFIIDFNFPLWERKRRNSRSASQDDRSDRSRRKWPIPPLCLPMGWLTRTVEKFKAICFSLTPSRYPEKYLQPRCFIITKRLRDADCKDVQQPSPMVQGYKYPHQASHFWSLKMFS